MSDVVLDTGGLQSIHFVGFDLREFLGRRWGEANADIPAARFPGAWHDNPEAQDVMICVEVDACRASRSRRGSPIDRIEKEERSLTHLCPALRLDLFPVIIR